MKNPTHVLIAAVIAVQVVLAVLAMAVLRRHAVRLTAANRAIRLHTGQVAGVREQLDTVLAAQAFRAALRLPAAGEAFDRTSAPRRHLASITPIRPDGAR